MNNPILNGRRTKVSAMKRLRCHQDWGMGGFGLVQFAEIIREFIPVDSGPQTGLVFDGLSNTSWGTVPSFERVEQMIDEVHSDFPL